jgi:hypothetical protein
MPWRKPAIIDISGNGEKNVEKSQALPESEHPPAEGKPAGSARKAYADLFATARDRLVGSFCEGSELRQLVENQLLFKYRELAGPDPSPLEALLVERVVLDWFQVLMADTLVAHHQFEGSKKMREEHQRQHDRASKRFLASAKALAQVRRLLGPNIQVNIAEKQLNVFSPIPPSEKAPVGPQNKEGAENPPMPGQNGKPDRRLSTPKEALADLLEAAPGGRKKHFY